MPFGGDSLCLICLIGTGRGARRLVSMSWSSHRSRCSRGELPLQMFPAEAGPFPKKNRLTADGKYGEKTHAALMAAVGEN